MRGHLLHRSNPLSWTLMPEVCERIERFSENVLTAPDSPPAMLIEALWQHFTSRQPQMAAFCVLGDEGLLAHCLVSMETWGTVRVAMINQYQVDDGVPGGQVRGYLGQVIEWAKAQGATQLQALAVDEKVERVFRQKYGFERNRVLIRRALDVSPPSLASPSAPNT